MANQITFMVEVNGAERMIQAEVNTPLSQVLMQNGLPAGPWSIKGGRSVENTSEFPVQPGDFLVHGGSSGGNAAGAPVVPNTLGAMGTPQPVGSGAGTFSMTFNNMVSGQSGMITVREGMTLTELIESQCGGMSSAFDVRYNYQPCPEKPGETILKAGDVVGIGPTKMAAG